MKKVGLVLILLGIILALWALVSYFGQKRELISPIPDDKGIKVIFITPTGE